MRKDEIEDRVIRLEQEIRTLKADHREGVEAILSELKTFQDSVIAEKVESVRSQLADGYERMIACLLVENAEKNLDASARGPCNRNHRAECDTFYLSRIREAARLPDPTGAERTEDHDLADDDLLKYRPFLTQQPCSTCFGNYMREKERLESALGGLSRYRESMVTRKNGTYITDLPDDAVLSTILDPLSHQSRFAMLKALTTGSMTFKDLGKLTHSKGGHLMYHITKLIDAGLVIKTDAGKRYAITDRGIGVMDLVKKMFAPDLG